MAHAVAPTSAPAPSTKMQPQLQHLPPFQPPSFEGADGLLPCPDSPGSTPRGDEEFSREGEVTTSMVVPGEKQQNDNSQEAIDKENHNPYPIGSFVEYKSRS